MITSLCRVYVWEKLDWEKTEVKDSSRPRKPLWTLDQERLSSYIIYILYIFIDQERLGEKVKDIVGSSTSLLLIRPSSVALLDFWEGGRQKKDLEHVNNIMAVKEKKFEVPKSAAAITEVLGKRRLGRESTKGQKKRCCSFC